MIFQARKVILACILSVFLVFSVAVGAQAYSYILAFGDSLSDNGQYYTVPVYGQTGNINPADVYGFRRFSNGPVWVEYLANDLGISLVSLLDMAYGGATTSYDNPAAGLAYTGLQWQVGVYKTTYQTISANTLVTVWAGGNDMFNGRDPITAAANIALAIQNLISMGGKDFIVPNLWTTNAWEVAFDPALAADLAATELANSGVDIDLLDLNKLTVTGINNYTGTWLTNSCANNPTDPNCSNDHFFYWDTVGVHPTTEVHQQIGAYAAASVPEPASIILLLLGIAGLASVRKRMK
jgi:phospholipase/lecithinase/hemolysin